MTTNGREALTKFKVFLRSGSDNSGAALEVEAKYAVVPGDGDGTTHDKFVLFKDSEHRLVAAYNAADVLAVHRQ